MLQVQIIMDKFQRHANSFRGILCQEVKESRLL